MNCKTGYIQAAVIVRTWERMHLDNEGMIKGKVYRCSRRGSVQW